VNIKKVKGFNAEPPKNTDLGWVIYYDGMEGGVARATDYMKDLMKSGYKITDKVNDTHTGQRIQKNKRIKKRT
jgi:hypothetical protein